MKRKLTQIFHTLIYICVGSFIGYYSYDKVGAIGIATNLLFLALGVLLANTWSQTSQMTDSMSFQDEVIPLDTDLENM